MKPWYEMTLLELVDTDLGFFRQVRYRHFKCLGEIHSRFCVDAPE